MEEINKKIELLSKEVDKTWKKLDLDSKISQKETLEKEISNPELWNNPKIAKEKMSSKKIEKNKIRIK